MIPATAGDDGAVAYRFGAAMTVDRFGMLHVVVVRPASIDHGFVEYKRQAMVGGAVTWLTDIVDDEVLTDDLTNGNAFAAIVVDDDARPHIVYRSGVSGNVYYATRFDR